MPNFSGPEGELSEIYLSETDILERYIGNQLWAWGDNGSGQLGDNTTIHRSSPVQTVSGGTNWKQVSCGFYHTAAIKTDGSLWIWGYNSVGSLGDNTTINKSSPVQTVSSGTNWKQVSCNGSNHTGAIKTDGTLWLWGSNDYGELGDNTITNRSSPVQTVSGGTNWKQISVDAPKTAAIKTDGTLWLWGWNVYGQLGTNDRINRSSPVQTVAGGTNWKQVSGSGIHTAAIKTDGTLWLWGRNIDGQLGTNDYTDRSSPVQTVAGGTNWKQVSASSSAHTAAIKTDGTLWLWGYNVYGQLGTNDINGRISPVQTISAGTNWKQVNIRNFASSGIKTDGTLWTWGYNGVGSLGDNTTTDRSSPVQTAAGGTNWKQVGSGGSSMAAVTYTES